MRKLLLPASLLIAFSSLFVANAAAGSQRPPRRVERLSELSAANAAVCSSVSLTASPSTATYGSLFTLVAAVEDQHGNPLTSGAVTFYDGASVLGTVQVIGTPSGGGIPGTATLKTILVPLGSNSMTAACAGVSGAAGASAPAVVTVTGQYPSTTTLAASGSGGNYALAATVLGAGPVSPTGSVLFTDATTGLEVGAQPLSQTAPAPAFAAATAATGVAAPLVAALYDLNGDGIPDLVTGSTAGLFVQLGKGDGTLKAPLQVSAANVSSTSYFNLLLGSSIVFGDFNADGRPDIAYVACTAGSCTVGILLGNGDGTFQPELDFDQAGTIGGLAIGDFNGDGIQDLAVANFTSGTVDLLLGNGDGTFQPTRTASAAGASSIAAADLNGDGLLDLAVSNWNAGAVSVLLGNGDGTFQPAQSYPAGSNPSNVTLADLRAIGKLDLVALNGAGAASVLLGNGDGTFQPAMQVYTAPSSSSLVSLALADVTGSGLPSLVLSDHAGNAVDVLPGNGDGTFQNSAVYPTAAAPAGLALADLNHDGRTDIAVAGPAGNSVAIFLNQAAQTVTLANAQVPGSGNHSVSAAYSGDGNFAAATSNPVTLAAGRVTPAMTLTALPAATVAWGQSIAFGITVSSASSLPPLPTGAVKYAIDGSTAKNATLSAGAVSVSIGQLSVGTHSLSVTYVGDRNYRALPAQTLAVTVVKVTPSLSWNAPAAISYGTALSAAQLNATASVPGNFSYSPASGTRLTAGQQTLNVTFTPSDQNHAAQVTATVTLSVNPAMPVITWNAPAAIEYGVALNGVQLNATAKVSGTFTYSPAAGTVLAAGLQTLSVTFTPYDAVDYTSATTSVQLTVNQATPAISWANPKPILYGTALGAAQLNATSKAPGTFAYSPAAGTVLTVGPQTLSVTFTPADTADYNTATATVTLTVTVSKPAITWPTPAPIAYGTALSATQLNATSPVAGAFVYSPATGAVLAAGPHTLQVTFTPSDTADYDPSTSTVTELVGPNIVAQPFSITVVSGHTALFTVAASSTTALTYQWQYLAGTAWTPFTAGVGFNTSRLTTAPTTAALSGLQVQVVVTDANGISAVSSPATLTVAPVVIAQPVSQTVVCGNSATFSAAVDGVAPLTYTWQYQSGATWLNYGAGMGYNSATLTTLPTTVASNSLELRVYVSDANGLSVASLPARLTVGPAVTSQPVNQVANYGTPATFTVAAVGVPNLAYLWQYWNGTDWVSYTSGKGATTATLTTRPISAADNGLQVRVRITDHVGLQVISDPAALVVAPMITTQPAHQTVPIHWTATFSVVAGGVPNLTYQWQYLSATTWTPFTTGAGYTTPTFTTVPNPLANDGTQVRVVVTDGNGLTVTSNAVRLTVIL